MALELKRETEENPLKFFAPTAPQLAWLKDPAQIKLFRGGNQIGKSTVGIVETLYRCLGAHPYLRTAAPPIHAYLVAHSWEQSKVLQGKIWELVPKASLHPSMEFKPGFGFRGTGAPVIRFRNNSILRIKTTQQARSGSTISLASATLDWILIDEPPPPYVFSELVARLLRKPGAAMGVTMTPIGAPVGYMRAMCEATPPKISDHGVPLTVENTTPIGCRPILTEEQLAQVADSYLAFDRNQRLLGDWEGQRSDALIFDRFSDDMISASPPPDNLQYKFGIGIDHGTDAGSQFAALCAVAEPTKDNDLPYIYVLDEYSAGADTAERHARGILEMLSRNRLTPTDCKWTGDRIHYGDRFGSKMSNRLLQHAIGALAKFERGKGIQIRTAYKPRNSVYYGAQIINEAMAKGNFQIHPRAKNMIKSIRNWSLKKSGDLDRQSEHKHALDALRYCIQPLIGTRYQSPRVSKLRYR